MVNIVPGYGHVAGARLAEHPDVGKVSFTGSTDTGRRIVTASAGNLKRLQLELGGKGANIVFRDADVAAAVRGSAFAIFHNQGQACIAGSRLLLHEDIAKEFLDSFIATARRIRIGHPLDPATQLGPLTSAMHRDRVLGHLKAAGDTGATILTGGMPPADAALDAGFYSSPPSSGPIPAARYARRRSSAPSSPSAPSPPTRKPSRSPTAPTTASAAGCGPPTCRAPTGSRPRCGPGWSGSTATSG